MVCKGNLVTKVVILPKGINKMRYVILPLLFCSTMVLARQISVGESDKNGNVSISIDGSGTAEQTIVAAWAEGDKGENPLDWELYADAGTVGPEETSVVFQIPSQWRSKSGAVRFFLMSGKKPYGKRLDFMTRPDCEYDGLYINTLIKPDSTLDLTVKVRSDYMSGKPQMCPFGISGVVYIMPCGDYPHAYFYDFFGAKNTTENETGNGYGAGRIRYTHKNIFGNPPPRDENIHEFRLNRQGLYIDGYKHLVFDQSKITGSKSNFELRLFDRSGNSSKATGTTCSIYGAKIVTNGVLAADLIPVVSPNGYVKMWDRVTRQDRGREGKQSETLAFIAGNDIGPYPPDCGTVEDVSEALKFGPELEVSSLGFGAKSLRVTLESGHGAGLLFAVAGPADAGTAYTAWTANRFIGKIDAGTDAVNVPLPREWWNSRYTVRFAWKPIGIGLPYDYAVSHIHSDYEGEVASFCNTGWRPTTNTTIKINAKTGYNTASFGINGAYSLFLGNKSGSAATINYVFFMKDASSTLNGTFTCSDPDSFVSSFHDWKLGPDGVFVDDMEEPKATLSGYLPRPGLTANICIPHRANWISEDNVVDKCGPVDVRSARVWEGDELVRDFTPCVKNGAAGFYDSVLGEFYASKTSKPFAAGEMTLCDGDFVSWSDAKRLETGFCFSIR